MEDMVPQVRWRPTLVLAQEALPLAPFIEAPMEIEENGAMLVQEDSATAEDDAMAE